MFIQVVKIIGDPRLWKEKTGCYLPITNRYTCVYANVCMPQAGILGLNLIPLATSHLILTPSSVRVGLSGLGHVRG